MNLFDVYPLFDITIDKGIGCKVYDSEGTEYLDLYGGHAVISVGHTHPKYVKALADQAAKLGFYSNSIQNPLQVELADKLGKISGCEEYSLFLINSGAEANENALKLASFHNGRTKIISFHKSFHGRTASAVRVTDNPKIVAPINDNMDVVFLPWNDLEAFKTEIIKGDVCAVIIEGIQGIGGIKIPDASFLQEIRALCTKTNTILILDEIQSGYGRSGKFFAFQYSGIKPDIITIAKGMGNGFPIGGVLISPIFRAEHGMLGTTFGGNHLGCVAAISVLDIIKEEDLIENSKLVGDFLIKELNQIPQIKEVRGLGLMIGLEFEYPVKEIRSKLLFQQKVFTGVSGSNVIRLLPPLSLSIEEANIFIERFKLCL